LFYLLDQVLLFSIFIEILIFIMVWSHSWRKKRYDDAFMAGWRQRRRRQQRPTVHEKLMMMVGEFCFEVEGRNKMVWRILSVFTCSVSRVSFHQL